MNRQLTLTFRTLAVAPLLFFWIGDSRAQDSAVPVTVAEVMTTRMAPRVPAAGTVFSRNATQVTAGIAGRLEWVAEPGDLLNAGQPVARFDCEMLELQREFEACAATGTVTVVDRLSAIPEASDAVPVAITAVTADQQLPVVEALAGRALVVDDVITAAAALLT